MVSDVELSSLVEVVLVDSLDELSEVCVVSDVDVVESDEVVAVDELEELDSSSLVLLVGVEVVDCVVVVCPVDVSELLVCDWLSCALLLSESPDVCASCGSSCWHADKKHASCAATMNLETRGDLSIISGFVLKTKWQTQVGQNIVPSARRRHPSCGHSHAW